MRSVRFERAWGLYPPILLKKRAAQQLDQNGFPARNLRGIARTRDEGRISSPDLAIIAKGRALRAIHGAPGP